mmetsp:Transcript_10218/g.13852  ORF Transcript_10218/g.13852 Transcript_10218/m.13852 type:complete len:81 (+) Transcript_10218:36-278(+)
MGRTVEEAMVVQAKICRVKGNTVEKSFTDLILEWKRGETEETSAPFGDIVEHKIDMNLAVIFNKLSIFFRNQGENNKAIY